MTVRYKISFDMMVFKTQRNLLILALGFSCSSSFLVGQPHNTSETKQENLIEKKTTFLDLFNRACLSTTKNLLISGLALLVGIKEDPSYEYALCVKRAVLTLYGAHYLFSKSLEDAMFNIILGITSTFIFRELLGAYDQEDRVRGCLLWLLLIGSNFTDSETLNKAITRVIAVLGHKKKTRV